MDNFLFIIENKQINATTHYNCEKHKETEKAMCFRYNKVLCMNPHVGGMIGSPFHKYSKKYFYVWIPKSVLGKSIKYGSSNIETKDTQWILRMDRKFFKVSFEHWAKKKRRKVA